MNFFVVGSNVIPFYVFSKVEVMPKFCQECHNCMCWVCSQFGHHGWGISSVCWVCWIQTPCENNRGLVSLVEGQMTTKSG